MPLANGSISLIAYDAAAERHHVRGCNSILPVRLQIWTFSGFKMPSSIIRVIRVLSLSCPILQHR